MEPWPKTQPSLLVRIRDANDHLAWHCFVELYAPPLYRYGRRQGLQDADASDLTQEIFRRVVRAMGSFQYDRQQGTFRGWLFTLTRNCYRNYLASAAHRVKRDGKAIGGSEYQQLLDQIADSNSTDILADNPQLWDEQYEHHLLDVASANIRENFAANSWQAFWQTAVVGKSPQEVASELGMSVGAVYVAKSRVIARLKLEVARLESH
jgi:RNA polymerase sigma-70 factor (ECF subfamily)